MLKQLRSKKAMKRVMFWTLVLVIPSFVMFYGWGKSSQKDEVRRQSIAQVKDRWFGMRWRQLGIVERDLASKHLEGQVIGWLRQRRMDIPPAEARNLFGAREIARAAIEAYYLRHLAREKGIEVTRGEIFDALDTQFERDPNSAAQFQQLLRYNRMSQEEFLRNQAYESTLAKAETYIWSQAKASLFELWQEYLISQETIQISYARIPSIGFEGQVESTTDSLLLYYQDNKEDYRIGDQVKYRYVGVFRDDVEKELDLTTDSIKAFYEENKEAMFRQKHSASVRHIFLNIDRGTTPSELARVEKEVRDKIDAIEAQIKAGADFAEMANEHSEDDRNRPDPDNPSTFLGGVLPYPIAEEGAPPQYGQEFKDAALSLKQDEVSTPVRSPFGYHLLKADSVTTAGLLTFEEVKDRAKRALTDKQGVERLRERGAELKNMFTQSSYSTLNAFAEAAKLPIVETELLDFAGGNIPRIGSVLENMELIEELKEGEFIEGVLRTPSEAPHVYFVLELNKKVPSHIPPFDEVIDELELDYLTSESAHLAHSAAIDMSRKAKTLDDLKRLAEEGDYTFDQTTTFTRESLSSMRGAVIPNLDPRFQHATLRYKVGTIHVTAQGSVKRPEAYIVWYFEKRDPPPVEQFREDLPMIQRDYLAGVQRSLVVEWFHDMQKRIPAESQFLKDPDEQEQDGEGG